MSTLAEIEAAIEQLPPSEKQVHFTHLAAQSGQREAGMPATFRRAGLHTGVWEVAEDFDASLRDESSMGRSA